MKQSLRGILLFVLVGFFSSITAQESLLKKQRTCAVYFASGSAALDANSIQTLTDFIEECRNASNKYELRLQAFTDDVGSPKQNEALAQERALAVKESLLVEGILLEQINIQKSQQLRLNPNKNAAEQRKNNRRVAVEYWDIPMPSTLPIVEAVSDRVAFRALFEEHQRAAEQQFDFDSKKGSLLEGKKGTILKIPSNCFVDKNGAVVTGNISLTLQEAYSYGDMLFQNLSTTSGDELLETGGMLFIEAKDSLGNVLEIGEDKEIIAAMASEEASLEEMQTFNGEIDSTTGSVNWIATNRPVLTSRRSGTVQLFSRENYNSEALVYDVSDFNDDIMKLNEVPVWEHNLPREVEKPLFRLRNPKYPRLIKTKKPSKEALSERYAQYKNESEKDYSKRIRDRYFVLQKSFRKKRLKNRKKVNQYSRDSLKYERALAKHELNILKYRDYNDEMRAVLEELYTNMSNFKINTYVDAYQEFGAFVLQAKYKNSSMIAVQQSIKYQVENNFPNEQVGIDLLAKISQADIQGLSNEESGLLAKCWSEKTINNIIPRFYRSRKFNFKERTMKGRFSSNRFRVANLYNRIAEEGNLKPYKLRQIRTFKNRIKDQYNYRLLSKTNENVQKSVQKVNPILETFLKKEQEIKAIQEAYIKVKDEFKELSPQDIAKTYGNALTIRQTGWINCDRFQQNINRTKVEIITGNSINTRVFAFFENSRSMLAGVPENGNFVFKGIPKNQVVKLIGLRILGGTLEVFIEEGKIISLNNVSPNFKKKTVEEVEEMMLAI